MKTAAPSISSLPSEKKSPCHATGRTHADESKPCIATRHLIGQGRQNPSARCGPRMSDGDRTSIHVDPIPVHRIGGGTLPALLPCRGVCQYLRAANLLELEPGQVRQSPTY